jgi:CubicO group peptidase (beta-lactamase class C family)
MHTTTGDIFRLLQAMLNDGGGVLRPELARAMVANQNEGLDLPWGLGWKVGKNAFFPDSGEKLFGHSGATGTLCWADPDRKLAFVLLTNRPLVNDKEKFLETVARMVSDAAPGAN